MVDSPFNEDPQNKNYFSREALILGDQKFRENGQ